jgi:TetR/AcrR family transcriptional repressor of mexJK operon
MARPKTIIDGTGQAPMSKQESILIAARQVFLDLGYASASMGVVAARANVSKATVYAHFDNKRTLFEAVISRRCEETFNNIGIPEQYTDARQALQHLAENFLGLILSPEALAIHRVVLGESRRLMNVGEALYAAGRARAHRHVEILLEALTQRGLLNVPADERPIAGSLFLAMLNCDLHTRALLCLPPSAHSIRSVTEMAVELFVAHYTKKHQSKP